MDFVYVYTCARVCMCVWGVLIVDYGEYLNVWIFLGDSEVKSLDFQR